MNVPLVSIQIVTYQSEQDITACLDSIALQKEISFEIIIIDNGSRDTTVSLIQKHSLYKKYISLIQLKKNLGFSLAHQYASYQAKGTYLFLLNPDARLTKDSLSSLVNPMQKNAQLFACQPLVYLQKKNRTINLTGKVFHYLGFDWLRDYQETQVRPAGIVDSISGSAVLIDKKKFRHVGGFDPHYFMYYEDSDLSWKARLSGFTLWYESASIVYHAYKFEPDETQQSFQQKLYYVERNRLWTFFKNFEAKTIFLLLPAMLIIEVALCFYAFLQGWLPAKLKIYSFLYANRSRLLTERMKIKKIRKITDREFLKGSVDTITFAHFEHPVVRYLLNPFLAVYWIVVRNLL